MALRKCRECGRPISTQATACPACGAPVKKRAKGWGCLGLVALVVLVVVCTGLLHRPSGTAPESTLSYEVLKETKFRNGLSEFDILVSESATREEVLQLAESLRRKYAGKYQHITIYDSRDVWSRALNEKSPEKFPEKELDLHCLVYVANEKALYGEGEEKVTWVAKGRDH